MLARPFWTPPAIRVIVNTPAYTSGAEREENAMRYAARLLALLFLPGAVSAAGTPRFDGSCRRLKGRKCTLDFVEQ